jgi:sulfatase maturation enzyme AslB (radical SAM superfamily)
MSGYSSCWWLHDHLELGPDGEVHACCYQYSNSRQEIRGGIELCRITGNTFPAEDIIAARQRVHAEIANSSHSDCTECPQLVSKRWASRRYLARSLTMNVWTHCNLKCRYCFTTVPGFKYSKVSYPLVEVIADMLKGEHLDPNGTVTWGGGDISALVEFNELSRMFLAYGIKQDFKTSAYKFLPGVAETIAKNLGAVEVSVDAGTRETYASYKGADVFERVVENTLRYRASGPIKLKYIAASCNLSDADIDGFVDLVQRAKPESVMVTPEFGESWSKQYDEKTIRQIAKLISALKSCGSRVIPENAVQGRRIFPDFWDTLAPMVAMRATPSIYDKIVETMRS